MKIGRILRKIIILRPLLKLFGVKDHTVVAKVGEGLVIVDKAVNEEKKGDEGVVLLFAMIVILMFLPVIAMIADALSY